MLNTTILTAPTASFPQSKSSIPSTLPSEVNKNSKTELTDIQSFDNPNINDFENPSSKTSGKTFDLSFFSRSRKVMFGLFVFQDLMIRPILALLPTLRDRWPNLLSS